MPPRRRKADDDTELTLRFKYGVYTIFQNVDPVTSFQKVEEELLEALRERFPDGLRNATDPTQTTEIPAAESDDFKLVYGVLKAPTDPSMGWKRLLIGEEATAASLGLKNNTVVGFAIIGSEEDADNVTFDVEFPSFEEEAEEEEEE